MKANETIFYINPAEVRYAEYIYKEAIDGPTQWQKEGFTVAVTFVDGNIRQLYFESEQKALDFINWLNDKT